MDTGQRLNFIRSVNANTQRRGMMLVLSSPSGAGKTTISRKLLQSDDSFELSISCTTRPRRPSEVAGIDYYFVSENEFRQMIESNAFLEYAKVHGHYYGTPRKPVYTALEQGRDVLFDVDWQGTRQLVEAARKDIATIFILPPSMAELERRLRGRAQDKDAVIERRIGNAPEEIAHWLEYDYVLVNEDLEAVISIVSDIITVERMKRSRQPGLAVFVNRLLEQWDKDGAAN